MNLHVRPPAHVPTPPATTRAAEGMERRAWTVAEVDAMVRAGIIAETERLELVGGELVPMSPKGAFHENVKRALTRHWIKVLPPEFEALTETTLRGGERDFREPDFVFWPASVSVADLTPADVRLIVEIADTSRAYDLGAKAADYASMGLPDYWVVDAQSLVTTIHRQPGPGGYASVGTHGHIVALTPLLLPTLTVRLADLGLMPSK